MIQKSVAFIILILSSFAQAQLTSKQLIIRNQLEKEIQQNLANTIGTQLEPGSYTVGINVKISPFNPDKKKEEKKENTLPAGVDLGIISAQELAQSYEAELEELKLKKDKVQEENQFKVDKIEVNVGLDEALGQDYQKKFSMWLQTKVKSDYGAIASSKVTQFAKKILPEEKPTPQESPLKKWSLLAVALILALALIMTGLLLRSGLKAVATGTKPIQIEPKSEFKIEGLPLPQSANDVEENNQLPELPRAEPFTTGDDLDRLIKKIAFICLEAQEKVNDLVRVWIDSGDEGFVKTALLIDTVLSAREKILTETGSIAPLRIPLSEDIAKTYEENISEAYNQTSEMPGEEKLVWLQKIYWDLVSVRTLGLQSLRRPFDFLQNMQKENLMELMNSQKSEARALALTYLPKETKKEILADYNFEEKENILKNVLMHSQVSDKKIWDLDTSVKLATLNQSANPGEKLVNLFPRTIEVLQSLKIVEEIKLLRRISPSLPEEGLVLKQQYNTFAFIDEWKTEYIKKLTQIATAEEVVNLIRILPEAKDLLLSVCPDKVKTIVEDDLKLTASSDENVFNTKLSSLLSKWNKLVLAEQVTMSKVISPKAKQLEVVNAA